MAKKDKFDDPAADKIDSMVIEPDENDSIVDTNTEIKEDDIPLMEDPKWSEWVLNQFEDDEVVDGNVLTDGLRRVVTKVLGPILRSVPVRETAPSVHNNYHAMVAWEVDIKFPDDTIRTFGDVADVNEMNTNPTFAMHASATAATKAEGRALRKALQLKRVLAAEEMSVNPSDMTASKINNGQISFMNMMCERLDIDVMKLINGGKNKFNKIEDIPYISAVQINKFLSECQNGKDSKGNVRVIPEKIKGYNPNWRNLNA